MKSNSKTALVRGALATVLLALGFAGAADAFDPISSPKNPAIDHINLKVARPVAACHLIEGVKVARPVAACHLIEKPSNHVG